jgi:hypothetical protein
MSKAYEESSFAKSSRQGLAGGESSSPSAQHIAEINTQKGFFNRSLQIISEAYYKQHDGLWEKPGSHLRLEEGEVDNEDKNNFPRVCLGV